MPAMRARQTVKAIVSYVRTRLRVWTKAAPCAKRNFSCAAFIVFCPLELCVPGGCPVFIAILTRPADSVSDIRLYVTSSPGSMQPETSAVRWQAPHFCIIHLPVPGKEGIIGTYVSKPNLKGCNKCKGIETMIITTGGKTEPDLMAAAMRTRMRMAVVPETRKRSEDAVIEAPVIKKQ